MDRLSRMLVTDAPQMATEHLFVLHSDDGGRSWSHDGYGVPAWSGPRNVMFQVFDACPRGRGIRTVSLCTDGRWGDRWTRVDAFVVDIDPDAGVEVTRIDDVSWQIYPNGAIIRRSRPDHVLVAQMDDGAPVIGEWNVTDGNAVPERTARLPGGLVFPFEADDGAIFAHTNYKARSTGSFYSDIVLTDL